MDDSVDAEISDPFLVRWEITCTYPDTPFTTVEIEEARALLRQRKAPGPDKIDSEIVALFRSDDLEE
eukprot:3329902-Prorocentrum_lima.AAC.1